MRDIIAPEDRLAGRQQEIWVSRDRKLEAAREARAKRRKSSHHSTKCFF